MTEECKKIIEEIKHYLLTDMLKNWEIRTVDREFGGYITDFDRRWNVRSTDKGAWGQGRQIFTFSRVYECLQQDIKWKEMAECGIKFMLEKMYAGNGRFNYLVSREGKVLDGTISIFSDAFFIGGLAKYIEVFKEEKYRPVLTELYFKYKANVLCDSFTDVAPFVSGDGIVNHSLNMIAFNTSRAAARVLGEAETSEVIERAIANIFGILYDEKTNLIYETKNKDGSFTDAKNARLVTVGHNYETLWFALDYAIQKDDKALLEKIKSIAETLNKVGRDEKGDSVYNADPYNAGAHFATWKYEIAFDGSDIVSWAYAEEMVLWAMLYGNSGEQKYFDRFKLVYDFCKAHFEDKEWGDWFHSLHNDYSVRDDFKGSTVKSAYHMPRAFMKIIDSLSAAVPKER